VASQSKSIACAAVGVLCLAASAWGQVSEPITGFETDRDGNALLMQAASFGDLEVCVFQDPREAVVTRANVVADIAATPPILPSTEESFTANFTADGFFGYGGSTQFMDIRFQWATPSNADRWVLVETLQSPIWGDPSLHLEGKVRMKVNFPNFTTEFPTLVYTQKVGVALLIRDEGKEIVKVHLGPKDFVDLKGIALKKGDRVKVKGVWAEIDGQDVVMAAKNNMKNQSAPTTFSNTPMWAKTTGKVAKPRLNEPFATAAVVPERPRKTNADVRVIIPPKPTSNNSLVALAVKPDNATSSVGFRYEA